METLQHHAARKRSRQRARAVEILRGADRSPSPLRRVTAVKPTTTSTPSGPNASSKPDIKALRESLQMTKIRKSPDSSMSPNTSGVSTPRPVSRRSSDPGQRGTMEEVIVTRYTVP